MAHQHGSGSNIIVSLENIKQNRKREGLPFFENAVCTKLDPAKSTNILVY